MHSVTQRKAAGLPLTSTDIKNGGVVYKRKRKSKRRKRLKCGPLHMLLALFTLLLLYVLFFVRSNNNGANNHKSHGLGVIRDQSQKVEDQRTSARNKQKSSSRNNYSIVKPLEKFATLHSLLDTSHLVALYFAASWCTMSTPVTELLGTVMTRELLETAGHGLGDDASDGDKPLLSLLYVSSDESLESLTKYMSPYPHWSYIPFDDDERAELKRHFKTCAKVEMEELGILNREHEIPTLIILDGKTHSIISSEGVADVNAHGVEAVQRWKETVMLMRGLEGKFHDYNDEHEREEQVVIS